MTIPECSCPRCVEELLLRFQPQLVEGRPSGIRTLRDPGRPPAEREGPGPDRLAA